MGNRRGERSKEEMMTWWHESQEKWGRFELNFFVAQLLRAWIKSHDEHNEIPLSLSLSFWIFFYQNQSFPLFIVYILMINWMLTMIHLGSVFQDISMNLFQVLIIIWKCYFPKSLFILIKDSFEWQTGIPNDDHHLKNIYLALKEWW